MRLLIVDDSSIIRARIARLVNHPGLGSAINIVGLARNGAEAVHLCRRTMPDVVTMDLTMPEMDGISCIGELVRSMPRINILVVSALSDKTTAIEALKRGARGFLNKPFTDQQLVEALLEVAA